MRPQIIIPDTGYHNADITAAVSRLENDGAYADLSCVLLVPAFGTVPTKVVASWWNSYFPPNQQVFKVFAVGMEVGEAFSNAIAPIMQQKCVSCHSGVSPAAALDLSLAQAGEYTAAYRNLMSTSRNNMRLVEVDSPPFARRSRLIDVLLGVGTRQGAGAHPDSTRALTAAEKRKFITWVDLGGQYE